MSWSFKYIGTAKEVKQKIVEDPYLPETLKAVIAANINDPAAPGFEKLNGVRVEGYGHANGGDGCYVSSIGKLEVEPLKLVLPVADAASSSPVVPDQAAS